MRRGRKTVETRLNRRDFLGWTGRMGLVTGAAGSSASWAGAAHAQGTLRLWLQSQWWRDKDAAACEKATGLKVQNTPTASNTLTLSKLMAGGGREADVIQISHSFVPPLIAKGALHEIDFAQIPNSKSMFPEFDRPAYLAGGGKQYGVPFVWGYDSLLYNADFVAETDSYAVLFDEKNKGRVGLRDDHYYSIATTALYLGYPKPFQLSKKDLGEVKKFLVSKKHVFRKFWTSFSEVVTLIKTKEIWATNGWLPMYWVLKKDGVNVRYPVTKERSMGWVGIFMIPKESPAVPAAHKFINWMLSTEWAAPIGRDLGYYSPSKLALKGLTRDEQKTLRYDQLEQMMQKLLWVELPENLQDWLDVWIEFKSA